MNGPPDSGLARRVGFALRERGESRRLVDALGLVGEEHRVAVERDPQLVGLVLPTCAGKIVAAA